MTTTPRLHTQAAQFCKHHIGQDCFCSFSSSDWPAFYAFCYLLQFYLHGGGEAAIYAMKATLRGAQTRKSVLRCFVQAIPGVLNWSDVAKLWPRITDDDEARTLPAVDRDSEVVKLHRWVAP
jgi:hypothetical protein